MAIRPIVQFPSYHLSSPCRTVRTYNNPTLKNLIRDLSDTMYNSPGVGLAAPQIGVLERVSVIDIKKEKSKKKSSQILVLINPRLLMGRGIQIPREGCLSVPDLLANVRRYQKVRVRSETMEGKQNIIEAEGFEALALQHEIDHLEGKLFLDRILNLRTDVFRRKRY